MSNPGDQVPANAGKESSNLATGPKDQQQSRETRNKFLLLFALLLLIAAVLAFYKMWTLSTPDCDNNCRTESSANTTPQATVPGPSASAPVSIQKIVSGTIEDDVVYSDGYGNTFEQHKAGDRLCRFYVNGILRKEEFVHGKTPEQSKKMCDIRGELFRASLTPNPKPKG